MKTLVSSQFKSFIYGTLLGDSTIHRNGKEFSTSTISRDLLIHKYKVIKKNLPDARFVLKEYDEKFDGKWNHQKLFKLRVKHPYFYNIFELFESNTISDKILKALKPNGIAVWYADDGTTSLIGIKNQKKVRSRRVELCTDRYDIESIHRLVAYFNERYESSCISYKTRRYKNYNEDHYRVTFPLDPAQKFLVEISKYFYKYYPSLLYKIDLGYRNDELYRQQISPSYRETFNMIKGHSEFKDRIKLAMI